MPAPASKVSKKAQTLSLIGLAWAFEESLVTPSVTKKRLTTNSNVVRSENNGSDDEIVYVARRRKKRKSAPLPASQSSESSKVQVIEQVKLDLEVDTQVDFPRTGHFALQVDHKSDEDSDSSMTDIKGNSVSLLAKDL
jgi:hypothetical protein